MERDYRWWHVWLLRFNFSYVVVQFLIHVSHSVDISNLSCEGACSSAGKDVRGRKIEVLRGSSEIFRSLLSADVSPTFAVFLFFSLGLFAM